MVTGTTWGGIVLESNSSSAVCLCWPGQSPTFSSFLPRAWGTSQPDASRMKKPHRMMGFPASPIHLQSSIWWGEGEEL